MVMVVGEDGGLGEIESSIFLWSGEKMEHFLYATSDKALSDDPLYSSGTVTIECDDHDQFVIIIKSKWNKASIRIKFDYQFSRTEIFTRNIVSTFKVVP